MSDEEYEYNECPNCGSHDTVYIDDDWVYDWDVEDEIHINRYKCRHCKARFDDRGWYTLDHEQRGTTE